MLRRIFEVFLYLSLLAGGLLFCWKNVHEYQLGATGYSASKEPISLNDLPTLVTCLDIKYLELLPFNKLTYGTNLVADFKVSHQETKFSNLTEKGKTVTLIQNKRVQTLFGLAILLIELQPTLIDTAGTPHQCYKITPYWNGDIDNFDIQNFQAELVFKPINFIFPKFAHAMLYISSEANSFGLLGERYYDGTFYSISSLFNRIQGVQINGVTEHINIDSTCSKESYYECLTRRFLKTDFDKFFRSYTTITGSNCTFVDICTPFTLPSSGGKIIPVCKTEQDRLCFGRVISHLRSNQEQYCMRSCNMKNFRGSSLAFSKKRNPYCDEEKCHAIVFKFGFSWKGALLNGRSDKLLKRVMREYWIVSTLSLVGTVGGTLGMFVGFSLMGTFEWLFAAVVPKCFRWTCKMCQKQKKNK